MIKYFFLVSVLFISIQSFTQELPDSLKDKLSGKPVAEQITYLNKLANNNLKNSPSVSFSLSKISYKLATDIGNKNAEVNSALLAGKSGRLSGKASESIEYLNKAIALLSAANQTLGLAQAYNELGLAYKETGKNNDALSAFEKSLSYYIQLNDSRNQLVANNNIGALQSKLGQKQKAIETIKKSVSLAETLGDKKETANSYYQLGVAYAGYGNYPEAETNFNKAKEIATSINNSALLSLINSSIDNLSNNLANKNTTEFEKEQNQEKENFISSLQSEFANVQFENLKSLDEINKLSFENQAKELKLHLLQEEVTKQQLENEMKAQNVKLLEAENNLTKADLEMKQEALSNQRKVLIIVGLASIILLLLLVLMYRLYLGKKKTLKIVREQKNEIQKQKDIIQESIDYAQHIQQAIIPSAKLIQSQLPGFFVFLRPRDVVSGDFYWYHNQGTKKIMAAIDCTGHGVAGGLMSMIANSLLNNIIKERGIHQPDKILEMLNNHIVETLAQSGDYFDSSMDITICLLDEDSQKISLSMAGHRCFIIKDKHLTEFDGSDFAIGGLFPKMNTQYELHTIPMEHGTSVFMFSDGYPDQDGATGRKLGSKAFTEIILNLCEEDTQILPSKIEEKLNDWMSGKKQRDDILVMGFKVK